MPFWTIKMGARMQSDTMERPKTAPLPRFLPVIFANGEDDDFPGLQAFCDDEDVTFDGRVIGVGESLTIRRRHIVLTSSPRPNGRDTGRWLWIDQCVISGTGRWIDDC